jgi:hypothetical protein
MNAVANTIDVERSSADVFEYAVDPSRFSEWQTGLLEGRLDRDAAVGARCISTRKIGGKPRKVTSEITAYDPPHHWADRGLDGPIRGIVSVDVRPLDETDTRCSVTISVDFEGHGIGKVLVPLIVRRRAAQEMPSNMRRLKERLERSAFEQSPSPPE